MKQGKCNTKQTEKQTKSNENVAQTKQNTIGNQQKQNEKFSMTTTVSYSQYCEY